MKKQTVLEHTLLQTFQTTELIKKHGANEESMCEVKNPGFGVRKTWVQIMAQPYKISTLGDIFL